MAHRATAIGPGERKARARGMIERLIGRQFRVASVLALVALIGVGYSAQAAIRAIIASGQVAAPAPLPPIGYETEDHFPGSALLYVAEEGAAPTIGTTGTTELPDLPIPADAVTPLADGTVHPAPPFSTRLASASDRARALQCLTAAIYYEAGNEPTAGQRAVAQVILNRVRHPAFPATVCGVVYQGSERLTGCQFSYACDGSMARIPARASWLRAMRVAQTMLAGGVEADVGMATHYHTYAVRPVWNRQLVMTAAIGAHFFHRWHGYWGTPAAFTQRYRGGEPVPGPHPRAQAPTPMIPAAPVIAAGRSVGPTVPGAPTPRPRTSLALIQPAYADSGIARPGYAAADALPESQILDKWKDSGKPLR